MDSTEARIASLEGSLKNLVYEYVCRSLFKVRHTQKHPTGVSRVCFVTQDQSVLKYTFISGLLLLFKRLIDLNTGLS